ncbi:MAG: DUF6922 domain-containing protein [Terriglobales bacterium]
MIPQELRPFFWDVDSDTLDLREHRDYVIARILEFGDDAAVLWMNQTYAGEDIRRVVRQERRLSPKSANFWGIIYDIPREEISALSTQVSR